MKILVTGAAGYLGRAMIEPFEGRHELRLMDVKPWQSRHEVFAGDVADLDACRRAADGVNALVIAHMASRQAGAYETPTLPFDANVKGTANLFFAAVEHGIRRVVLISSTGAVAGHEGRFLSRDLPVRSKGLYGLTKACQEVIAEQFQREHDMEVAVLRPAWIIDADTMVTKYGDRLQYFDEGMIDRRDLGEAARLACELPDLKFEIFYVHATAESPARCDVSYTHRRLGWKPKHDFSWLPKAPK